MVYKSKKKVEGGYEFRWNKIYFLVSLDSKNELRRVQDLFGFVRNLNRRNRDHEPEFLEIHSVEELSKALQQVGGEVSENCLPYLHLEMHGDDKNRGLVISGAKDVLVEWEWLGPRLCRLNEITDNNLFVSLAVCSGGFIQKIASPVNRAPYFGFVGPQSNVKSITITDCFGEYFEWFIEKKDVTEAILRLNRCCEDSKFYFADCYDLFDMTIKIFFENLKQNRDLKSKEIRSEVKALWKLKHVRERYDYKKARLQKAMEKFYYGGELEKYFEAWEKWYVYEGDFPRIEVV